MLKLIRREGLTEAYEARPIGRMIWAGLRNELKTVRHALRARPAVRFVIFAQGRTGSTLLTSTLDTHPHVICHDEILGLPRALPHQFVANAARGSGAQAFGFHVKIYQLTSWQRVRDVRGWLSTLQGRGWKIIYLRRENLLRHVVSNVFAEAAGTYHHRSGTTTKRPDRITLDVERLRRGIDFRRRNLAAERQALSGLDRLELVYERDLESAEVQAQTFARIQSFLGVEEVDLTPRLRKAVAKPLAQLVENYDDVRAVLSGTPDEAFLDK
jgi:LPS sulfotransferase NodH